MRRDSAADEPWRGHSTWTMPFPAADAAGTKTPLARQRTARVYDRAAAHWDGRLRRFGYINAYVGLLANCLGDGLLPPVSRARVLDCGVGTGALSRALVAVAGAPRELHGIDVSPEMVGEASRLLAGLGLRPALQVADACRLPFAGRTFDVVLMGHAIEHVPDPALALAEIRRVLRPEGTVILVVTRPGIAGRLLALRYGNRCHSPQSVLASLGRAGFEDCRALDLPAGPWCRATSSAYSARGGAPPPSEGPEDGDRNEAARHRSSTGGRR